MPRPETKTAPYHPSLGTAPIPAEVIERIIEEAKKE